MKKMNFTKQFALGFIGFAVGATLTFTGLAYAAELGQKAEVSCEDKSTQMNPPEDAPAGKVEVKDANTANSTKNSGQGK